MNEHIWHDRLQSRYLLCGELKIVTPLRVSSGVADDVTDAPVICNSAGIPYIPGSSIRGAIRSAMERTLAGLGPELTGLRTCILFTEGPEGACDKKHREKIKDILEEPDDKERNRKLQYFVSKDLCDMCRLFGTTTFASRLFFKDAFPTVPAGIDAFRLIRDGVGIDRDTGAAVSGAKYDYEVIDPGDENIAFFFSLMVENATGKDKKLIGLMLALLEEGLFVGGKRAGGLGMVRLKMDSIKVAGFSDAKTVWDCIRKGLSPMGQISDWKEVFKC